MKYLETKHERNSAKITTLIVLILILLCFVVGQTYQDPPEEYGVAINFGNSAVGSGNVQPDRPVKSRELSSNEQLLEEQSEPTESQESTETQKENVLTQDTEEAIAIKKAKEQAEANAKAKADKIAKKKAEEAKKKAEIDAIMGGYNNSNGDATGNEGDDNQAGDKGQLNGDPYAPSYFGDTGTGTGGVGYGLNGRGKPTRSKVIPDCQEEGRVVVEIHVNQAGKVIKAIPGKQGTTGDACLFAAAKKTALTHKWPADSKAPTKQIGFVKIDFTVGK